MEGGEGVLGPAGGGEGGEDGGEGGHGDHALGVHGADGVPHGIEELVLAEDVDNEVPGVGAVLVGEVAGSGPPEEGDSGGGAGVGELEDLLDVGRRDADAGVVEGALHGGGRVGFGDDLAEKADLRGQLGDVKVGGEGLPPPVGIIGGGPGKGGGREGVGALAGIGERVIVVGGSLPVRHGPFPLDIFLFCED